MYTLENLYAADIIPFSPIPKIEDTTILSEELNIHQDIAFGIKGKEYFHSFFRSSLLYDFIFIYL